MVNIVENIFNIISYVIIVLYGIIFFGLWKSAPQYLNKFIMFFNLFIAIVLIILFNPLRDTVFLPIHKKIVFSAGLAMLINSSLTNIITPLELIKKVKKVRFNI